VPLQWSLHLLGLRQHLPNADDLSADREHCQLCLSVASSVYRRRAKVRHEYKRAAVHGGF